MKYTPNDSNDSKHPSKRAKVGKPKSNSLARSHGKINFDNPQKIKS